MNKTPVIASAALAIVAIATISLVYQRSYAPQPTSIKSTGAIIQPSVVKYPVPSAEIHKTLSASPAEIVSASADKFDTSLSNKFKATEFLTVLEQHKNIGLSQSEIEQMLNVYLKIGEQQSTYEASIATVTIFSPTENFIEVPKYALAGARLRDEMYQQFSKIVGANRIEPIKQAISGALDMRCFGWGESDQQILITRDEIPVIGMDRPFVSYQFEHKIGTINVITPAAFRVSSSFSGVTGQFTEDDLGRYSQMSKFLPKRGS